MERGATTGAMHVVSLVNFDEWRPAMPFEAERGNVELALGTHESVTAAPAAGAEPPLEVRGRK